MINYIYLLKVIICSSILVGYYFLVLRNKVYHQYNRFYLLIALVLSWAIPLIDLKIQVSKPQVAPNVFNVIYYFNQDTNSSFAEPEIQYKSSWLTLDNSALVLFVLCSMILLFITIKSILIIIKIRKENTYTKLNKYKVYITQEPNTPFSFFKSIFWNSNIEIDSTLGKQILQHEITHIEEKHSWDKIFMQLNLIVGWFNPMFWLIKKELEMIHEFIADKKSVPNADTEQFAKMILNTAFAGKNIALTNPFFFSPLKRRLVMLTKNKLPKFSYAQRIIALPVAVLLVFIFSLKAQGISVKQVIKNNIATQIEDNEPLLIYDQKDTNSLSRMTNYGPDLLHFNLKKKYKVIIDAGHGGADKGALGIDGSLEKNITLEYAKTIKEINENGNIELVLLRDADIFFSPKEKAEFINNANADLFVSLHANDAGKNDKAKGIEIITVSKEKDNGKKWLSDFLASYVGSFLMDKKFDLIGVRSRQVGIWILQATKCPGILIEAGFVSNKEDVKRLQKEDYKMQMCKQILNGLQFYFMAQENNINMIEAKEMNESIKNMLKISDENKIKQKNSYNNDSMLNIENFKEKNNLENDANMIKGVSAEEIKLYKSFEDKARVIKRSKDMPLEFDFDKFSRDDEEKMFSLFNKMSKLQQEEVQVRFREPVRFSNPQKPTQAQLTEWLDSKMYGIWIDNSSQVSNTALAKYKATDFADYNLSKLMPNAANYGKHYYQVDLMTHAYHKKLVEENAKKKYTIWYRPSFIKKPKTENGKS